MRRRLTIALLTIALAAAAGLLLRHYAVGTVRVAGSSMEETLMGGDLALVTRETGSPGRGDVVECRFPGRTGTYVKRIVALPGDSVVFSGGQLSINGEAVDEPYASSATEDYAVQLGEDEYLALGDNRQESYDSRMEDMGPIAREDILGRVRWILYPLNRFGPIQ